MDKDILISLTERYNEPHRYYHTWNHIARMFEIAKQYDIKLNEVQTYAILFHDAIYDIPISFRKSNELRSGNLAYYYLRDVVDTTVALTVRDIILSTQHHLPLCNEAIDVIDLDLWDLSTDNYDDNSQLIQCEWESAFSNCLEYNRSRAEWLKLMLARKSIFVSEHATKEMEERARNNLNAELEDLVL